jgi:hypothetical protein
MVGGRIEIFRRAAVALDFAQLRIAGVDGRAAEQK